MAAHLRGEPAGLRVDRRDRVGVLGPGGGEPLPDHHPGARLELVLAGLAPEVAACQLVQRHVADGMQYRDGVGDGIGVDGRPAGLDGVAEFGQQLRAVRSTAATTAGAVAGPGNGEAVAIAIRWSPARSRIARRKGSAGGGSGVRVADAGAGDRVQQGRAVAHGAGQRVFVDQPFQPVPGRGRERRAAAARLEPHEPAAGCGDSDRSGSVAAGGGGDDAGRHRRRGSTAGPARGDRRPTTGWQWLRTATARWCSGCPTRGCWSCRTPRVRRRDSGRRSTRSGRRHACAARATPSPRARRPATLRGP